MDWGLLGGIVGPLVGVAGVVVAYRANKQRDKDIWMKAFIEKVVEPLAKADIVARIDERTKVLATKEDIARVEAKVDQLINKTGMI